MRREEAERLLLSGLDIGEISWRLGYAEPPIFHRAFKRWTQQTPSEWRRQAQSSTPSEELPPGSGLSAPNMSRSR